MEFKFDAGLYRVIEGPDGIFRIFLTENVPEGYKVIQEPPIDPRYWALERWHMHVYYKQKGE